MNELEKRILLFIKGEYDEELNKSMKEINDLFEKNKINKKDLFMLREANKYEIFIKALSQKHYKNVLKKDLYTAFVSDLKKLAKKIGISLTPETENHLYTITTRMSSDELKIYKELLGTDKIVKGEQDMIRARHFKRTIQIPSKIKKANKLMDLLMAKRLSIFMGSVYEIENDHMLNKSSTFISDYTDNIKDIFGKMSI